MADIRVRDLEELTFAEWMALWQLGQLRERRAFAHFDRIESYVVQGEGSGKIWEVALFESAVGDEVRDDEEGVPFFERFTIAGRLLIFSSLAVFGGSWMLGFVGMAYTPLADRLVPTLLLFAVSPGICEELLWRGTFQGELEPRRKPVMTVILVALFFGLFHQSIYRIVPTGLLGGVLALVRYRTGSIFPCMLLHAVYNGSLCLLFQLEVWGELEDLEAMLLSPGVLVAAAVALPLCLWSMRPRGCN